MCELGWCEESGNSSSLAACVGAGTRTGTGTGTGPVYPEGLCGVCNTTAALASLPACPSSVSDVGRLETLTWWFLGCIVMSSVLMAANLYVSARALADPTPEEAVDFEMGTEFVWTWRVRKSVASLLVAALEDLPSSVLLVVFNSVLVAPTGVACMQCLYTGECDVAGRMASGRGVVSDVMVASLVLGFVKMSGAASVITRRAIAAKADGWGDGDYSTCYIMISWLASAAAAAALTLPALGCLAWYANDLVLASGTSAVVEVVVIVGLSVGGVGVCCAVCVLPYVLLLDGQGFNY